MRRSRKRRRKRSIREKRRIRRKYKTGRYKREETRKKIRVECGEL